MRISCRVNVGPVLWLLVLAVVLGGLAPVVPAIAGEGETPTEVPVEPTEEPTLVPVEPTAEPTETPVEPTAEPTEVPVEPTAEPSEVPVEPTREPTAEPTEEPQSRQGFGIQSLVELTGTITTVPSNANPVPGEIVAFTITASGTAQAGTVLRIMTRYELAPITYVSSSAGPMTNANANGPIEFLTDDIGNALLVDLPFTVPADGAYSASITVHIQVKPATTVGETIDASATLHRNGEVDVISRADANLTVTGGTTPLTSEITKTATNANPLPGENVTFTITASGTAPAGTRFSLIDLYDLTPMTYVSSSTGTLSNVTAEAPIGYFNNGADRHVVTLSFNVPASGAYSVTILVQLQVKATTAAGEAIFASAQVSYLGGSWTVLDSVRADLTVTAPTPLTGEVTMVPSTANPVPGENVTFTVEATGTAPAGSALSIVGFYRVLHFGSVSPSIPALLNATATTANGTVVVTEDPAFRSFRFDFTVTASGAYSVRFTVDAPVLSSVPVGTSVTPSVRIDGPTGTLNGATAFLTVAANPTPPTVTVTASKPYPRPNESLTYNVTVSGEAYAGTTFTLTDLLPGTVTLVGVETVASTNVDAITLTPGEPVTGTFAVPAAGSFSVTFAIETTVNRGLSPGTEISNTACVDVSAGPQDTCATAQVATLNFSALIQLLIALLLSLLGPLTP